MAGLLRLLALALQLGLEVGDPLRQLLVPDRTINHAGTVYI
jgi:hypothetical protein